MALRHRLLPLLVASACVLLAACGGSGGSGVEGGGDPAGGGGATPPPSTNSGSVRLAWSATGDPRVVGYRVYYGTSSGRYIQAFGAGVDAGSSVNISLTGLQSGTQYYFAVTAYDSAANESGYSAEVSKLVN